MEQENKITIEDIAATIFKNNETTVNGHAKLARNKRERTAVVFSAGVVCGAMYAVGVMARQLDEHPDEGTAFFKAFAEHFKKFISNKPDDEQPCTTK